MNKRQWKKKRKKIYKAYIEDVALEISLDSKWRKQIFKLMPNTEIEISYLNNVDLPEYIQKLIVQNKLVFSVMRINSCEEKFDNGLVIFKFQSKEYPQITRYSGNNPQIV